MVVTHSLGDELGRAARNGALLDDDGTLAGVLGDDGSDSLESSHVGGAASTDAALLGGRVDRDEDNIGFGDATGHISGEEEVALTGSDTEVAKVGVDGVGVAGGLVGEEGLATAVAGDANNVMQAGFVNGRVSRIPATDSGLVTVDDGDLDARVLEGENCRGRTACEEGVR